MDFTGKNVIVTGGFRGIGLQITRRFLEAGANVSATYFSSEKESEAEIARYGEKLRAYKVDFSDEKSVDTVLDKIVDDFDGKVDVLINNAGIAKIGLFALSSQESLRSVMQTDFFGMAVCCKKVLLPMIARKGGAIVNVSSVSGIAGIAGQVEYSAAKSAIIGLTKSLAKEMGPKKIRVNAVAPGFIDTDMVRALPEKRKAEIKDEIPMGRMGTAEEVASAVLFLASEDASYVTGQTLIIDGGLL